jgi:polar amino acid transport system substrate-binding protein
MFLGRGFHAVAISRAAAAACATVILLASSNLAQAACDLTGAKGSDPISPASPGLLTVETSLPSPGWWNGDTPDTIKKAYPVESG